MAAYVDGQPVVDVVAGVADPATGRPGGRAAGHAVLQLVGRQGRHCHAVHRLIDSGAFTETTRVAELWPESARHGKDAITVRQVLDHSAGVPGLPAGTTLESVCDWEAMVHALEDAEPWWEPCT